MGRLILKAAEWSPQSHELFPEAARKRAVEVMRLGYLIAWDEERFDGEGGGGGAGAGGPLAQLCAAKGGGAGRRRRRTAFPMIQQSMSSDWSLEFERCTYRCCLCTSLGAVVIDVVYTVWILHGVRV